MKLSVNVVGQTLLVGAQALNAAAAIMPKNEQFHLAAALGLIQLVLSVLAHYSNPDGTPSTLPTGLDEGQMATYKRIFSK